MPGADLRIVSCRACRHQHHPQHQNFITGLDSAPCDRAIRLPITVGQIDRAYSNGKNQEARPY